MITQENVSTMVSMITPDLMRMLIEDRGITWQEASELLYNSVLYSALEDEATKLWHLSSAALYDMLIEELDTGRITTIPEEQS